MAVISKQCYWCAEKVGIINLWANTGLLIVKLIGGIFGRSQALIADAIHSVTDIVIAVLVLVGLKITGAPPDEDHPWGHGNIEFIVSGVIGVLLLFAAVTIVVVSLTSIFEGVVSQPGVIAVLAALVSVAVNEFLFRHSLCIGKQMNSPAMIANAWENRADVYTSMAALIGVFGARLGFAFLDPVGAVFVAVMIAKTGINTLITAIHGITDRSVDGGMLKDIRRIVEKDENVEGITRLRARRIGQKSWVDLEVRFPPELKISEVREVVNRLDKYINEKFEVIGGVHIIPRASEPE